MMVNGMTLFEVIQTRRSLWDVVLHLKIMRWCEELERSNKF